MAFTFQVREVPTKTARDGGSRAEFEITISYTSAGTATEAAVPLAGTDSSGRVYQLPQMGRIFGQIGDLTAGSGSTVDPVLGNVTDPATGAWRLENGTAGAQVFNYVADGIPYSFPAGGSFYERPVPDSGSDNAITTRYLLCAGLAD